MEMTNSENFEDQSCIKEQADNLEDLLKEIQFQMDNNVSATPMSKKQFKEDNYQSDTDISNGRCKMIDSESNKAMTLDELIKVA